MTSPSLYFKQTGSSLQLPLTSSPFNTDGRAPIAHNDEPFTVLQTYGLLPTTPIDELSTQHEWTSSYFFTMTSPSLYFKQTGSSLQFSLTSSPFNTDGRAPIAHNDEPFTVLQTDGLLPTTPIDELSTQHERTSSYCSQ